MTDTRPRDPDCTCGIEFPGARRIWCDHCLTDGPLPGSLADPDADLQPAGALSANLPVPASATTDMPPQSRTDALRPVSAATGRDGGNTVNKITE